VVIPAVSVSFWLTYGLTRGAINHGDSLSYIALADALSRHTLIPSVRTPGYPLIILAARLAGRALATEPMRLLVIGQVVLLSGVATWLLWDLVHRMTGNNCAAALAALIIAADADLQHFTSAILTEAPSVALSVLVLWLRIRDSGWARAGWAMAALVLIRPNFVVLPVLYAAWEAIYSRKVRTLALALAPTVVIISAWFLLNTISGTDAMAPARHFGPLHLFGKVYDSALWRQLPEGSDKRIIADAKQNGLDVYEAAQLLTANRDWQYLSRPARAAFGVAPLLFLGSVASSMPLEVTQGCYWPEGAVAWAYRWRWIFYWRWGYRHMFYHSALIFALLCVAGTINGLGWRDAVTPLRHVVAPFVAALVVSTAAWSLGTESVGRLALALHPINAMLWALMLVTGWRMVRVGSSCLVSLVSEGKGCTAPGSLDTRAVPDGEAYAGGTMRTGQASLEILWKGCAVEWTHRA